MPYQLEDFEVLKLIGSGSFASCYKVINKHTREILVWKVVEYGGLSEEKKQLLVTEVSLLRDLRHQHIVNYYDRIIRKDTKQLYILMEYCSGGDLATLIKTCKRGGSFVDESFVWRVLHQLSSALEACQSWLLTSVVLHRDIKPANVFLDENGNVKLGDFGLARKLDPGQTGCSETMVGTPFYMSPEVMKGEIYNCKSDVWSLGCLAYELCALSPPFHAQNIKELAGKVTKGWFPRIPSHYSEDLQNILCTLLVVNQEERPSTSDLVYHPIIRKHLQKTIDYELKRLERHDRQQLASCPTASKAPPPSPADREPEEVSKDTFRGEWLARLQTLREREAILRDREQRLDERDHALTRREHKVALMERTVRDKLSLAEVYLKRVREGRPTYAGQGQYPGSQHDRREVDESFSADPGDTSVLPTTTWLDPTLLTKPSNFMRTASERHVHFSDQQQASGPLTLPKPMFLKVAEAIRGGKSKEVKPKVEQKVLNLPGYTGPAITVDVPVHDVGEHTPEISTSDTKQSSPVQLKVLFDDREELRRATHTYKPMRNTAGDIQGMHHSGLDYGHIKRVSSVDSLDYKQFKNIALSNARLSKPSLKIGSSVDSLLDDKPLKPPGRCFDSLNLDSYVGKTPQDVRREVLPSNLNEGVLRKNAFGGSTRRRKKSSCRSSTPASSDSKSSQEYQKMAAENARNDVLLSLNKNVSLQLESRQDKRKSVHVVRDKENVPAQQKWQRSQKNISSSVLALPTVAAAALTSRIKAQTVHYR